MPMKVQKGLVALLVFMASMVGLIGSSMAGGEDTFKSKKCGDCHATSGPSKIASIEDWGNRKGPDLWFAGSKFNKEWLAKWLKSPEPIRGIKWNTLDTNPDKHPDLGEKEADEVAEYLAGLKDNDVKAGAANAKVNKLQAKNLFEKKYACYSCHQVGSRGKTIGGASGPTFVRVKDRLNPDWVATFMKNPDRYEPKGMMPRFTYLSDGEMADLAGYMMLLE